MSSIATGLIGRFAPLPALRASALRADNALDLMRDNQSNVERIHLIVRRRCAAYLKAVLYSLNVEAPSPESISCSHIDLSTSSDVMVGGVTCWDPSSVVVADVLCIHC